MGRDVRGGPAVASLLQRLSVLCVRRRVAPERMIAKEKTRKEEKKEEDGGVDEWSGCPSAVPVGCAHRR